MLRRTLAMAAFLLASVPATLAAQEYPPEPGESLVVSDSTVTAGDTLDFEGRSFAGGSSATMMLFSAPRELGTFTADPEGVVRGQVTIPSGTSPGEHTLELSGTAAGGGSRVLTATITVAGAGDGGAGAGDEDSSGFAFTGSSTLPVVTVGAVLTVLGAAVVLVSKRRRVA